MRNLFLTLLALLAVAVILLLQPALAFRDALGAVPPGVRLAGTDYGSAKADEVSAALNGAFNEPVAVYYAGQRIILRPQMVGFKVDGQAMLEESQTYGKLPRLALVFLSEVLNRPLKPVDVPLRYAFNRDALDNWLSDVASRYDRPPQPPQPVLAQLTVNSGQPGWQLDLPASRDRVIASLTNPNARRADLAVREAAPVPVDMRALESLLRGRLEEFPGIGGLFLHDINSGEEVSVNADVAFAGMTTLRIPILMETYRKLGQPPDADTRQAISETMTLGVLGGNQSANQLLELIGGGDAQAGVAVVDESLRTLGLRNTFMAAPFDQRPAVPRIVTPANSRNDVNTHPDPYIQTTPRDMGLVLEMLVECGQSGGPLLAAYAGQLTAQECQQALAYLALNDVHDLLTKVVPSGMRLAHRHAYSSETHADNAVIWGPAGPYVLSVFLYQPGWLELDVSASTMQDLSQAVLNYYAVVTKEK